MHASIPTDATYCQRPHRNLSTIHALRQALRVVEAMANRGGQVEQDRFKGGFFESNGKDDRA